VKTVILAGGKGTRLGPLGDEAPKPLLRVGDRPLLWHIMKIFAAYGHGDFVVCVGHRSESFERFAADDAEPGWSVTVADTGEDTPTGGRIKAVEGLVDGDVLLATYGDGVADVDLDALVAFHRGHGRIATVTTVRPHSGFGIAHVAADGRITGFEEKPLMREWVNGGFFVFDRGIFDYLRPDSVLERDPFERLVADGEIMAFRHEGFWSCVDTYKDHLLLNERWQAGDAPWRIWEA
jgi:glucose-1-phosphate cytidylyltransferase